MDPFLEHPEIFPGLYDRLVAYLSEALQPLLPASYYTQLLHGTVRAGNRLPERPAGAPARAQTGSLGQAVPGQSRVAVSVPLF